MNGNGKEDVNRGLRCAKPLPLRFREVGTGTLPDVVWFCDCVQRKEVVALAMYTVASSKRSAVSRGPVWMAGDSNSMPAGRRPGKGMSSRIDPAMP